MSSKRPRTETEDLPDRASSTRGMLAQQGLYASQHERLADLCDPVEERRLPPPRAWTDRARPDNRGAPESMCRECDPRRFDVDTFDCRLREVDGQLTCGYCGLVHGTVPNHQAEYTMYKDGDPDVEQKKQRVELNYDPDCKQLCTIDEREVPDTQARETANLRLNQCLVLLRLQRRAGESELQLSEDEVKTARVVLRAASLQWGREGCDTTQPSASPCFWMTQIARELASRREGGFKVGTEDMREAFSVDGVWKFLSRFQGMPETTDESDRNETRGHSRGDARAARAMEKIKTRLVRIDPLGSDEDRIAKTAYLSGLIQRSGVWKGEPRGDCLSKAILDLASPAVDASLAAVDTATKVSLMKVKRRIGDAQPSRGKTLAQIARDCGLKPTEPKAAPFPKARLETKAGPSPSFSDATTAYPDELIIDEDFWAIDDTPGQSEAAPAEAGPPRRPPPRRLRRSRRTRTTTRRTTWSTRRRRRTTTSRRSSLSSIRARTTRRTTSRRRRPRARGPRARRRSSGSCGRMTR